MAACLLSAVVAFPQKTQPFFFQGSFDDLLRNAKKQDKEVLIYFENETCSSCRRLEDETFTDKALTKFISKNLVAGRINLDTPDGKLLAAKYDISDFPAMVITKPGNREFRQLKGYYPAGYLLKMLKKQK